MLPENYSNRCSKNALRMFFSKYEAPEKKQSAVFTKRINSLPGVSAWPRLSPSPAPPCLFSCSVDPEFPETH